MFGFKLNERLGKWSFWFWIIGFFVAFMPLYYLGAIGMTRRLYNYDASTGFQPWLIVAWVGSMLIAIGVLLQVIQIIVSIKDRHKNRDLTGDPWNGRSLEWATASPAPFYNFARDPVVDSLDGFWEHKKKGLNIENRPASEKRPYEDIHMPRNTGVAFVIGAFALAFGFAMIWHIWWLAVVGLVGIIASVITRGFNYDIDYFVKAKEVEETESEIENMKKVGA
jgi:cytochrome o ubiquinol oxidase subunit 1